MPQSWQEATTEDYSGVQFEGKHRVRHVLERHNPFREDDLNPQASRANFAQVQSEDRRTVSRTVDHYNIDAIVSVGYRVNSKRGLREAHETFDLLARILRNQALVDDTGQAVLDLITEYANTWRRLLEYDEDRLKTPPVAKSAPCAILWC